MKLKTIFFAPMITFLSCSGEINQNIKSNVKQDLKKVAVSEDLEQWIEFSPQEYTKPSSLQKLFTEIRCYHREIEDQPPRFFNAYNK